MICAGHEEKIPNPILKALKTKAESNLGRRRPKRTWTEAIKRGFEKKIVLSLRIWHRIRNVAKGDSKSQSQTFGIRLWKKYRILRYMLFDGSVARMSE